MNPRWLAVALIAGGALACSGSDDGDSSSSGGSSGGGQGGSGAGAGNGGSGGSSAAGGNGGSSGNGASGGNGGSGGGVTGEWEELISGTWTLGSGTEDYQCVTKIIEQDTWIKAFRPIEPEGTHHTVVSFENGNKPAGQFQCGGLENGPRLIYGSGVGTGELTFPEGVAMKLPAGSQIMINLHLFNVSPNELQGKSGVEIIRADPSEVTDEAGVSLMGKDAGLLVEPGNDTETGYCSITEQLNVFAVMPHMHELGRQMRVAVERSGQDVATLMDRQYSFDDQSYTTIEPIVALSPGDKVRVECDYFNPGMTPVPFGESTNNEMCYAVTYVYPNNPFFLTCTQ